ncbi:hypothetical protein BC834DRAFT_993795 [Gloeopeniophorella convolvens]|nr:hypothetical protein BC834DRAFT_993795 [Gloeopeniophorella convolvens]
MNEFTEDHSKHLLSKEWLVKVDGAKSVPYLMKVHATLADQSCVFLITDTRTVWVEALSKQQLLRRWSTLDPSMTAHHLTRLEEDDWLDQVLQSLMDVHSLGVMDDLSFDVVESRYSDMAFELRGDALKWRWETFSIGPRQSADVLSKHLITPLLSAVYLAFTSPEAISGISENNLEKAVDQIGRTARRSMDTHIRNIFMHPQISTSLRRISALFDFSTNLPAIIANVERLDLSLPTAGPVGSRSLPSGRPAPYVPPAQGDQTRSLSLPAAPVSEDEASMKPPQRSPEKPAPAQAKTMVSTTETDDDDDNSLVPFRRNPGKGKPMAHPKAPAAQTKPPPRLARPASPALRSQASASAARSAVPSKVPSYDSDSPPRPNKRAKSKRQSSSSDESGDGAMHGRTGRRGTRQPIKRGGRRF